MTAVPLEFKHLVNFFLLRFKKNLWTDQSFDTLLIFFVKMKKSTRWKNSVCGDKWTRHFWFLPLTTSIYPITMRHETSTCYRRTQRRNFTPTYPVPLVSRVEWFDVSPVRVSVRKLLLEVRVDMFLRRQKMRATDRWDERERRRGRKGKTKITQVEDATK